MNLARQQAFLADLYTLPDLYREAIAQPAQVAQRYGLPVEWIGELLTGQTKPLEDFRHTLQHKRRKQVLALLPRTFAEAPETVEELLGKYLREHPQPDPAIYTRDGLAFVRFCKDLLPGHLAELMRYEWDQAEGYRLGKGWRLIRYRYAVWPGKMSLSEQKHARWVLWKGGRPTILPF